MKNLTATVFNLVVVALVVISVLGYFFMPVVNAEVSLTFTPEIADLVLVDENSADLSEDDKMMISMIEELANERISISAPIKVEMNDILNCGLSKTYKDAEAFLYGVADDIANGFDKRKIQEIENSVMKASLSTTIKMELSKIAQETGDEVEKIMQDLQITDEYVEQNTEIILDSIRSDNANVDSVAQTVMTVIDDVYVKIESSSYADQVGELTPETRQEIEDGVKEILEYIANEDGTIDGEEFIYTFISQFLNQSGEGEGEGSASVSGISALYSPLKTPSLLFEELEGEEETGSLENDIREALRGLVTPDLAMGVKQAFFYLTFVFAFACFTWIWLVIKILFKLGSKNPLVKLKFPIIFGWGPCLSFYIIPTVIFKLLANPPAFLEGFLGAEILSVIKTIFDGGLTIAYSSSTVFAGIGALALFIFGFFYAPLRRSLKKS